MKKLLKPLKSKAMLRIAMFATLFVLLDTFIEMNKKTEEKTTYSITLEILASANIEADGEGTPNTMRPCMTFSFRVHSIYKPCGTGFVLTGAKRKFICSPGNYSHCTTGTLVFKYNYNSACQAYSYSSSGVTNTINCDINN